MHIMSIDDSKAVHAYLAEAFDGTGSTMEHYFDGQQAIAAVVKPGAKAPDVILLDWEMPVMSGIDALPALRGKLPDTIIIMATSKNAMSDIIMALERGASDYIMKPFTKDILIGKIEQLLGRMVA